MGLRLRASQGRLPAELALSILEYAEYNPRIVSSRYQERLYYAGNFWEPGPQGLQTSVAALYLTTSHALPSCFRRASSITLQMCSADQRWASSGGNGTHDNSHSWFEVCILRRLPGAADPVPPGPGGDEQQQRPLELQMPQWFRSPGDADQELEQLGWQMVNHNGSNTWMVHHNSMVDIMPPLGEVDHKLTHHLQSQPLVIGQTTELTGRPTHLLRLKSRELSVTARDSWQH